MKGNVMVVTGRNVEMQQMKINDHVADIVVYVMVIKKNYFNEIFMSSMD
jgi:hypothetical protein